jgi:ureidoacrylate peracid hydrolase
MERYSFILLIFAFLSNIENATAQQKTINDSIYLTARPDSVLFTSANTVVIVIDMQNDFGAKGGMFDKAGIDISSIQNVIDPISSVITVAREKRIEIIYLKMGFKADLSDLGSTEFPTRMKRARRLHIGDTIIAPDGSTGRILVQDTWNTDILPALKPQLKILSS